MTARRREPEVDGSRGWTCSLNSIEQVTGNKLKTSTVSECGTEVTTAERSIPASELGQGVRGLDRFDEVDFFSGQHAWCEVGRRAMCPPPVEGRDCNEHESAH